MRSAADVPPDLLADGTRFDDFFEVETGCQRTPRVDGFDLGFESIAVVGRGGHHHDVRKLGFEKRGGALNPAEPFLGFLVAPVDVGMIENVAFFYFYAIFKITFYFYKSSSF